MTDNEIIKALECCISSGDCKGCPSYIEKDDDCLGIKWLSILDLINRQQAEIERLHSYSTYKHAQSEAIKEFAERLKETPSAKKYNLFVTKEDIDNLVKEMVGEE